MHAISRISTASEPLVDRARVEEPMDVVTKKNSSLPDDLDEVFPTPRWTRALIDGDKQRLPQTIAHRGYKAVYPENTLRAFQGAVEVGTHAIETDIHLTKDDVVVLSHVCTPGPARSARLTYFMQDLDLKRCFGREEKIINCDWQFVSQQRTLKAPHEPMPRLADLLEYIAQPAQQHIWILLDIKVDNDANNVMRLIAETIQSVDSGSRRWNERVVLGIWAARYLPLCAQHLPGFAISYIGFSTYLARQFLKVPNVSFNMLQKILIGPIGTSFIKDVKKANRALFVWTVDEENMMRWSIQKEMDGVITDDPRLFKEICDKWTGKEPKAVPSWSQWLYTFWLYILLTVFWLPLKRRFPESVDTFLKAGVTKARTTQTVLRVER